MLSVGAAGHSFWHRNGHLDHRHSGLAQPLGRASSAQCQSFLRALIGFGIDGIADPADGAPTIEPTAFTPPRIILPGVLIAPIATRSARVGTSGHTLTPGGCRLTETRSAPCRPSATLMSAFISIFLSMSNQPSPVIA